MPQLLVFAFLGFVIYRAIVPCPVTNTDLQQEMEYQKEDEEFEKSVIDLKDTESYKRYIVEESTR